jgi:hypothetical protein
MVIGRSHVLLLGLFAPATFASAQPATTGTSQLRTVPVPLAVPDPQGPEAEIPHCVRDSFYLEGSGWAYRSQDDWTSGSRPPWHETGKLASGYVHDWCPETEIRAQLRIGAVFESYDASHAYTTRGGVELEANWLLPWIPVRVGPRISISQALAGGEHAQTLGLRVRYRFVSLGFDTVHVTDGLVLQGLMQDSRTYAGIGVGLSWEPDQPGRVLKIAGLTVVGGTALGFVVLLFALSGVR